MALKPKILLILLLLLPLEDFAQSENFGMNKISTEKGLSNNHVTWVLEDSKGFLWMATADGLNRWNGYSFDVFRKEPNNPNSLPGNYILNLAEDHSHNIWIGTNNSGLVKYNDSMELFRRYSTIAGDENSLPGNIIRCIVVDSHNNTWIGTNYGLAKYNPELDNFERFTFPTGMSRESTLDIRRIIQTDHDEITIQNNMGLFSLNIHNGITQKIGYDVPFYNENLFTQNEPICFDSFGNLWVGSPQGLIKYHTESGKYQIYKPKENDENSLSSINFSYIYEDSKKNLWIGTQNRGVNLYDRSCDYFTVYQENFGKPNSLSSNTVTHVYEDSQANLWISTKEGGVNYINQQATPFEYFSHNQLDPASTRNSKVGSIHEDRNGNIWIGTVDGGINKFVKSRNSFERNTVKTDYLTSHILGIENYGDNSLYVTGWEMGLYSFDFKKGTSTNLMQGVEINNRPLSVNIKGIKKDSKGNIWLATHEKSGIMVYVPSTNKFYNAANPGPFDPILMGIEYAVSFIEDSKKRLWVNTYAGIYMFDTGVHAIKNMPNNPNSLGSNYCFELFEDSKGNIWVGNANGLDLVIEKNGEFIVRRYNDHYDLPINIKGILEDKSGNLWLSSNQGLSKFNPESGEVRHYRINKEIPDLEFHERARLTSSTGEMYFGGIKGVIMFHPDSLRDSAIDTKLYITDFQLFNKSQKVNGEQSPITKTISETKSITLSHDQSVLTFGFLGLNFNPYKHLEYAYKMEGFDDEWYFVGDKRFATYTNLPPGKYNFRVQLAEGNVLQKAGTELSILIRPPFWLTGWAYLMYVIIIACVFYFFRKSILYREKLRNELKLEKLEIKNVIETNLMKLRFFTNVSHEFRTPLTLIKAPIDKLLYAKDEIDPKEKQYHYNLIKTNTVKLLNLVDQLMDYRKLEAGSLVLEPSQGDIVSFCMKVWSIFEVLASKSNITYEFNTSLQSHMMSFDADKLDKIISNLLSNAFKNTAENGHISLSLVRENITDPSNADNFDGYIHIIVKDDGVGIPKKDHNKIFERFYSVNRIDPDVNKGTGIGLALSKELAELHKGNITVTSRKGAGATFKLTLPYINTIKPTVSPVPVELNGQSTKEKSEKEIDSKINGYLPSDKPKILILEDDEELAMFLANELKSIFEVSTAKDGKEGLSKAVCEIPNIILSDVTMPEMDGFEFCHHIKSDERTSHIPVVLLTARYSQEKQLEGLESGADDYIIKPFNLEILKLRINNLLHSRKELANKFKNGIGLVFKHDAIDERDNALIQSIIDIVLENIEEEKINADFIAKRIFMSRSLVYLKIEALTGQSVNEFIRNIRLKKSIQMLKDGSKNITEIAYSVGFSSQSYYSRSFVKQFGVSPKDFLSQQN